MKKQDTRAKTRCFITFAHLLAIACPGGKGVCGGGGGKDRRIGPKRPKFEEFDLTIVFYCLDIVPWMIEKGRNIGVG